MKNICNKKTFLFLLNTFFLAFFSFLCKNLLMYKFDNSDFVLFKIEFIKNYGAAFSMLHTHTYFLVIISLLILLCSMLYIFKNIQNYNKREFFYSSMLIAGIVCNLVERITDGFVTDYIKLNFIAFPIFNLSDVFICIGAFMLICMILFNNESKND